MNIENLLTRYDEEEIQDLIGKDALRFIQLLNKREDVVTKVKDVLIELYTKESLLLNKKKRGILIDFLKPKEAKNLAKKLSIKAENNLYEKVKKVSFRRGSAKERILFNFFDMQPPEVDEELIFPSSEEIYGTYTLFPHQRAALKQILERLSQPPRRVLLHMPTGSGKTRTAMHVISDFMMQREKCVVVWLAYSEELCEQAVSEFKKAWSALGNRTVKVHRFWKKHSIDFSDVNEGLIVAGLSKTYNASKEKISFIKALAKRCSLVVIDEAHQAIAETYKLILDALFAYNEGTGLLGLTATPGRSSTDISADQRLADFFNRNKVTLHVQGFSNPVEYLISEKYLAKTEYVSLNYEHGENFEDFDVYSGLDIPKEILKKLAKDELRNLKILASVERMTERHKRILVFSINVEHSKMLAAVLRARGFDAISITANTPGDERKRVIENFKDDSKDPKILCNYGVLTTGFDAPKTSAAVIARPTKSLVLFSQMVGRVIRGVKVGGNKKAEVMTVVDTTLPGFRDLVESFNNWEDVWD